MGFGEFVAGATKLLTGVGDTVANLWGAGTNAKAQDVNYQLNRENLDWMKATQAQQWEREDTSYLRTRNDMLQAGLNPLSMQGTNGAGEVVSLPQLEAPQYQAPQVGQSIMNAISGIEETIEGKLRRDSIQTQIDAQRIKNAIDLKKIGAYIDDKGNIVYDPNGNDLEWKKSAYEAGKAYYEEANAQRDYKHKVEAGIYDSDTQTERAITAVTDWLTNGRAKATLEKIKNEFPWLAPILDLLSGNDYTEIGHSDGTYERKYSNGKVEKGRY